MTRLQRFQLAVTGISIVVALLSSASGALAAHSVPSPHEFMDFNNNGVADASDSIVPWNKRGSGWTTGATSRVTEALASWSASTDFNPFLTSTPDVHDFWLDGSEPANVTGDSCPSNKDTWVEIGRFTIFAVNCRYRDVHPGYVRITNSDIFLNSDNIPMYWGTSNNGTPNARGILTHEIGHAVYLKDIPLLSCGSTTIYTMCGSWFDEDTYDAYSLTTDDVNAANLVYP